MFWKKKFEYPNGFYIDVNWWLSLVFKSLILIQFIVAFHICKDICSSFQVGKAQFWETDVMTETSEE